MSLPATVSKHPDEHVNIALDFVNRLAVTEQILSATAETITGTITLGTPGVNGRTEVVVEVSAGADGEAASFEVEATTDASQIIVGVVDVTVDARDF